ncbi:MAG: SfnB family sulfur acquisition oxidoreductase, partial [Acidocella sp.]|nr:SfnB family sulfur acquisition oxidoreductase [Acidocella sp.]
LYSQSGLWGLNIPAAYGGADLSWEVIAKAIAIVSGGDPSVGQLIQNHLDFIDTVRTVGTQAQKDFFFPEILRGLRTGNAFSEFGSKTAGDFETKITRDGENYRVNGTKYYCSGAYLAHVVPIIAVDDAKRLYIAVADRHAPGLSVNTDWTSFGQRTTVSGTTTIENVLLPADRVFLLPDGPSANGPLCQIVHAAVDAGIARAAFEETLKFVREYARPWIDSGQDKATDDPHTQFQLGDIAVRLRATEALLAKAGRVLDKAVTNPTAETVAAASIAVAEAKVLSTEVALLATNKLFELGGTRSVLAKFNLDRHWRNARTHTLHDPVRWKYNIIGEYYLNNKRPPQHSWI